MSDITFTPLKVYATDGRRHFSVKVNKRVAGTIKPMPGMRWQYYPKGSTTGGPVHDSFTACKADVEGT